MPEPRASGPGCGDAYSQDRTIPAYYVDYLHGQAGWRDPTTGALFLGGGYTTSLAQLELSRRDMLSSQDKSKAQGWLAYSTPDLYGSGFPLWRYGFRSRSIYEISAKYSTAPA